MMITLDGVMQAPGGPEEDTLGGFKYGGWTAPCSDESFGKIIGEELSVPVDLLLGKKTYKIFAEGTIPAAFELIDSKTLPSGVSILANYKRSGEVKTGSF